MPKIKSVRMTICKSLPYTGTREKLQHFSHCIPNADLQTTRTACPLEGVRIQMSWSYFFVLLSHTIQHHQKAWKFRLRSVAWPYASWWLCHCAALEENSAIQEHQANQLPSFIFSILFFLLSKISLCLPDRRSCLDLPALPGPGLPAASSAPRWQESPVSNNEPVTWWQPRARK